MKLIISAAASPRLFLCCSSYNTKKTIRNNEMRARDRVIEFGKHKGKMLGMVSSEYLRWMSKNLKTGDMEKWGKLAEDVLEDEVYADRMEWEQAERLLSGEGMVGWGCGVAGELEETSKRFGWDYNDKVGWSKVDFKLLGTSKGGRLPRVHGKNQNQDQDQDQEEGDFKKLVGKGCIGVGREKRRARATKKREQQTVASRNGCNEEKEINKNNDGRKDDDDDDDDEMGRSRGSAFPGRQFLINKVLHATHLSKSAKLETE